MGLWDKMLRLIGFEVEETEDEANVDIGSHELRALPPEVAEEWVEDLTHGGKKRGTLVSLPGQKQVKVIVVEPQSFEETPGIADHLKSRRPIILNLESTDREHAQRILNFLSGCTYALGGEMQRISNGIFFFAPSNIDVSMPRRPVQTPSASDEAAATSERRSNDFIGGQARDLVERRSSVLGSSSTGSARSELADEKPDDRGIPLWHK